jgi:hypothetical protein
VRRVGHRLAVAEAEDVHVECEEPRLDRLPELRGVVSEVLREEGKATAAWADEEIGDERGAALPVVERVLRRPGARREGRVEPAR